MPSITAASRTADLKAADVAARGAERQSSPFRPFDFMLSGEFAQIGSGQLQELTSWREGHVSAGERIREGGCT